MRTSRVIWLSVTPFARPDIICLTVGFGKRKPAPVCKDYPAAMPKPPRHKILFCVFPEIE
jgi:hypothetical protein